MNASPRRVDLDWTYLAAVARLSRPLRVGELALDGAGKVVVGQAVVGAQRRRAVLDALGLGVAVVVAVAVAVVVVGMVVAVVVAGSLGRH